MSREDTISPPPLKRRALGDGARPDDSFALHASPFRLTKVRDMPAAQNVDTVSLHDLLGDPLIEECWLFDYLFDVDFVMKHFDEDVRGLVKVKIVHGSWKREDSNKVGIDDAVARWKNVEAITAYMPEMYGTHHSKMMVMLRHDDTAQVVIHTANMIDRDWRNFTQAVWQSPRLPLQQHQAADESDEDCALKLGSGSRFKSDLLRYLAFYGDKRTGPLSSRLKAYDFSEIRAALVASVPTRVALYETKPEVQTSWGWVGVREILHGLSLPRSSGDKPIVVAQVSSVGTLSDDWIARFRSVLTGGADSSDADFRVMFPTAGEIRRSLDGYAAGASIHFRAKSARQQKMLTTLRPMLVHWAGDAADTTRPSGSSADAGRRRAAPHVKTYIRFRTAAMDSIDWALLTSANLSTQAWGDVPSDGSVRISSYELGVLVWPGLHGERGGMAPSFGRDTLDTGTRGGATTALRLPYGVPLVPYGAREDPWIATASHAVRDWRGDAWAARA